MNNQEIPKDIKKLNKEDRKELYKKVCNGEIRHKQLETSKKNLRPFNKMTEAEAYAIRRKGWEKMQELKGERKNAKQCLEQFLPLFADNVADNDNIPEDIKQLISDNKDIKITQYDLIMLSMINQARNGNIKAAEYIRDTYGDKPINESHTISESISISDKQLIEKISNRLNIYNND